MKVMYHHKTRCSGADGTHIKGIVDGFKSLGYQVDVISYAGCNVDFESKKLSDKDKRIATKMPRILFEMLEVLYNIPAILRLVVYQIRNKYDIVYERYALLSMVGCFISIFFRKPLFLEVNFTTRSEIYPKRTGVFRFLESFLEHLIFKRAAIIYVISDHLKHDILSHGIDKEKILVLPNAVDIEHFKPMESDKKILDKYGITKKDRIIGWVGCFAPWHGLDLLLDSFKLLLEKNKDVKVMLIGGGQTYQVIKQRIKEEHLDERAIFTGRVLYDVLPAYINMFDIAVVPDAAAYTSPVKMFEYMAMQKPVVGPRLKNIKLVISDGQEGILFNRKDAEGLKNALINLLSDSELSTKMGAAGRKKVSNNHTWRKNVEKIIDFYNSITDVSSLKIENI
ncbi:MAG: glycosyltransferase family 4 protein [Candidatus Omnitrophica bacterium]|nr:glycosyltransferase family 4 protein [Candidatus Omnitrophota bacterium]